MSHTSEEDDGVPKFKKEFLKFHNENGVKTIIGSIGPVKDGECPLDFWISETELRFCRFSSDAVEEWLQTCVYFTVLREEAQLHPQGCCSRLVWI